MAVFLQLALALCSNLVAIYFLKKAHGFTVLWPTVWALVAICLTQGLVSRAMESGVDTGLAITIVVVGVMIGSALMGNILFQESLSPQKIVGFGIAILGVALASLAKTQN